MDSQFTDSYALLADMMCILLLTVLAGFVAWLCYLVFRVVLFILRAASKIGSIQPVFSQPPHVASLLICEGKRSNRRSARTSAASVRNGCGKWDSHRLCRNINGLCFHGRIQIRLLTERESVSEIALYK
jgi:hypothetical protein